MKTPAFLLLALAAALHAAPPEPKFRAVTIDDAIQIGYGVAVADVDGDKWPDILLADEKQFVWYRNPGPPKPNVTEPAPAPWDKFILAENLTKNDNVCLAAQDIDGDGKCEIAVGAEWNPGDAVNSGAVFYLIPTADRTQKWEPVKLRHEPTVHRMKWIQPEQGKWKLAMLPLHGRGNKNGEGEPAFMLLYDRPTDPKGEWPTFQVSTGNMTHNFDVHHTAGKDDAIFVASRQGINVYSVVLAAPMVEWSGRWVMAGSEVDGKMVGTLDFKGAGEVRVGSDFKFIATVEPMHGNQLVIYQPPWPKGIPYAGAFRRVLTDKLTEGHALRCGDLLGTASDQIVVGWRGTPGKEGSTFGVHLWTPLDAEGKDWRDSVVDDGGMACEDLVLADLNGDGKLDIIASGRATHNVKVYFNETPR